ncbi:MAG: DUF2341 domain-containing protein [Chitinispirillaceae bacterium]|nr:DUF2341 domain-containing protein [Chitinispirillaceae bacterium]
MAHRSNCVSLAIIAIVTFLYSVCPADDYSTWSSSRRLVFNTTANGAFVYTDVRNVPILIRLNPGNFSYFSQTLDSGADIRFSKTDGTHLHYQIERWVDNAGNNDTAEIWVKIDTVYGDRIDQALIMYWGNPDASDSSSSSAVFETANGFIGVWHLGDNPSAITGTVKDASGNGLHGMSVGGMSSVNLASGIIGRAHYFDGADDGDSIPFTPQMNIADAITISGWVNVQAFQSYSRIISRGVASNINPWTIYSINTQETDSLFRGEISQGDSASQNFVIGTGPLQPNNWYHVTLTYDRSNIIMYRNGIQDTLGVADTDPIGTALSTPLMFGKSNYNTNAFRGIIDEARLEKTVRDKHWIKLCYENQKNDQSLIPNIATLVWDTSSEAQYQNGSGIWGTGNRWSTNGTQLLPWLGRSTAARFAGSGGPYTVTVNGRQQVDSIIVVSVAYTFTGGTLDFGTKSGILIANGTTTGIASVITGTGGLSKSGMGTLILSGACTYTGPTTVTAGALFVDGSLDSGTALTATTGTTIGGAGEIKGDVSAKGTVILPGTDGLGTLRMGSLVLDSASRIDFDLGSTSDSIVIDGNLTLDGTINISAAAGFGPGTYRIITYGGTIRNDTLTAGTTPAGRKCTFEYGDGFISAVISSRILQTVPYDTIIIAGNEVEFTASAEGSGAISYLWERYPSDSVGSGSSYTISSTTLDDNGSRFRCIARDSFAADTSQWAVLTVIDTPEIIVQPHDTTVLYGSSVSFSFALADTTLCSYRWFKEQDGSSTILTTDPFVIIDSVTEDDEADYYCSISNPAGTVITTTVHLTAKPPAPVAGFSCTPASGIFPLAVSFTDTSSGSITSREWYFGDGSDDTATNPVHSYEAAGLYTVTLKITGPGGSDSLTKKDLIWVYAEGQNPLRISAEYLRDTSATIVISGFNLIDTTLEQYHYDSIGLWISPKALPQNSSSSTLMKTWELSELTGNSLTDIIAFPSTDSVYGLMTAIFWSDGTVSEFNAANGTIVLLYDTIPSDVALQNALHLTQLVYDSTTASLKIAWCIETEYFKNNLEVGVTYSLTASPQEMTGSQIVKISEPCTQTVVDLSENLRFDTTYYVTIFARTGGSKWPEPNEQTQGSVTTGQPFRQIITYFEESAKNDTVSAFNEAVLIWKNKEETKYTVVIDTLQVYPFTVPEGFKIVGIPFYFVAPGPGPAYSFYIGIRVNELPAGASLNDIHFYREDGGSIYVDYTSIVDEANSIIYKKVTGNDLAGPFIAMFDERAPQVTFLREPDSTASSGVDLIDSINISDNIMNVRWTYLYSSGDEHPVPRDSGTLDATDANIRLVISGSSKAISSVAGVRALLLVSDGAAIDTLNLSRSVLRTKSDAVTTIANRWCPIYATAKLDNTGLDSVIIQLNRKKVYDDRLMRLFRWYQTSANTNSEDEDKWIEYNPADNTNRTLFSLTPGKLLWLKTWKGKPLHLGSARTLSPKDTFTIQLPPHQYTDFGMPFRFGVHIRDILAAGASATDNMQFYIWTRDSSTDRYYLDNFYLSSLPDKNDPMAVVKFSQSGGYSIYNPGLTAVTLHIPPTLADDAGVSKKTASTEKSPLWSTKFITTTLRGTDLPALYCGYAPELEICNFPVTPTFLPISTYTLDRTSGKKQGHYINKNASGGLIREIRIANSSDSSETVTYRLENVGAFPECYTPGVFNPASRQFSAGGTITIPPATTVSRWLVVGDADIYERFKASAVAFNYGLRRIYPNPARAMVNFRFTVGFNAQETVVLTIFDLHGRKIWEKHVSSLLSPEKEHLITWNGRDRHNAMVGAGRYPIRLSFIDNKGVVVQRFDRILTYIP